MITIILSHWPTWNGFPLQVIWDCISHRHSPGKYFLGVVHHSSGWLLHVARHEKARSPMVDACMMNLPSVSGHRYQYLCMNAEPALHSTSSQFFVLYYFNYWWLRWPKSFSPRTRSTLKPLILILTYTTHLCHIIASQRTNVLGNSSHQTSTLPLSTPDVAVAVPTLPA